MRSINKLLNIIFFWHTFNVKKIIFYILTLSLIPLKADLFYSITEDEFTDEKTIALAFLADDSNEIIERVGAIICFDSGISIGFGDGILFHLEDFMNVKIRFGKNPMYEERFAYSSSENLVLSSSKDIIRKFLFELSESSSFIVRLDSSDSTMKFSNLINTEKKVNQFLEAANRVPSCRL